MLSIFARTFTSATRTTPVTQCRPLTKLDTQRDATTEPRRTNSPRD